MEMVCRYCGKKILENISCCPFCGGTVHVMQNNDSTLNKLSAEKEILLLSESKPIFTLKDILLNTRLEIDEAEKAIKSLIDKGVVSEKINSSGQSTYSVLGEGLEKQKNKNTGTSLRFIFFIVVGSVLLLILFIVILALSLL